MNRSELYKLYQRRVPEVNGPSIGSVNVPLKMFDVLLVSLILTLDLSIIVVMINYFKQIVNSDTINNLLPMIVILLVAWMGFLFVSLSKVSNKLSKTSIDSGYFYIIYGLIQMPLSQLSYNIIQNIYGSVTIILFIPLLFFENIIIISLISHIITTSRLNQRAKLIFFTIVVLSVVLLTIASNAV